MKASNWWSNLGMQAKFQILTQAFLFVLLIACQQWISNRMERFVLSAAEERIRTLADGAINGLNTLMVTKVGEDEVISDKKARALFIEKMGVLPAVKELRIVRGKAVVAEFDEGLPQERPVDEMDQRVLAGGKSEVATIAGAGGATLLRAVVPFVAKKDFRGTNCLKCHGVEENAVLGAASIVLDISDEAASIRAANLWIWASLGIIQAVLFLVIGFITRRAIIGPLQGMRDAIAAIEQHKDFTRRLPACGEDEIAQTANTVNRMVERMQEALREVYGSVSRLRGAADDVAAASRKVLEGSSEQSNSSASMAAAIEQMTVSIGHVSSSADDALKISNASHEVSEVGGRIIGDATAGMDHVSSAVHEAAAAIEALGEQSRQITSVVQVIREVAEQTNLLALNAAIEAARAGESGRGFAVVADEVRKLAERTSKSTTEISTMVDAIQTRTDAAVREMQDVVVKVGEGQDLAGQAGAKITEIREQSANVASSFSDITVALREQDLASQEIARNVENIASIADENLAVAESMASSVEHLNGIARQVDATVSVFRV